MVEVTDQSPKNRVEQDGILGKPKKRQRKVQHSLVHNNLSPLEAERDNPVHLTVFYTVMTLVKVPEERDAVKEVVNTPLHKVNDDECDDNLHP